MYAAPCGRAPRACAGIPVNAHAKGPLRPLQSANRLGGHVCVGHAKAASGLQCVFEAHRGVPPIQHDGGIRQRLALDAPQSDITVAQSVAGVSAVTPAIASACLQADGGAGTTAPTGGAATTYVPTPRLNRRLIVSPRDPHQRCGRHLESRIIEARYVGFCLK
jgi:hypothetical protein